MSLDPALEALIRKAEATGGVATEAVEVDLRELRALLRFDCEVFIEFFLADQLDMPVPQFHKEIWERLTDTEKERVLLAIPRDHAKTTLAKLVVIWYWLFTNHRFCAYLSNTNPIAKGACKDIIEFLHTENFVAVFGRINMVKSSENESLWVFDLPLAGGGTKRCMLRAIGQGQQMRGINLDNQRPDIAVIDDVEDNENTESEHQQKKLDRWMFGPFLKALARRKKILWLGNMLTKTSLLARLSRSPKWNPVVFGALVKDTATGTLQPLWPGKWTLEALKEDFKEYRDLGLIESWMCEMMNMPGHGENGFASEQMRYRAIPTPDQCRATFITIDPAFGQKRNNDESSVAVHAIFDDAEPMVVAVSHGRWTENQLFDEIFSLAQYWNAWTWGVESVAAQKLLLPLFNMMLAARNMFGFVEIIELPGSAEAKLSRVKAFVSLMSNGEWDLPEGDVDATNQFLEFNFKSNDNDDDIIDSIAYGPLMMGEFLELIIARAQMIDLDADSAPQYGTEICSV